MDQADVEGWVTADTLDFGACLFRCVLMGQLREHSFELKGYLLRTNIIPHFVATRVALAGWRESAPVAASCGLLSFSDPKSRTRGLQGDSQQDTVCVR